VRKIYLRKCRVWHVKPPPAVLLGLGSPSLPRHPAEEKEEGKSTTIQQQGNIKE